MLVMHELIHGYLFITCYVDILHADLPQDDSCSVPTLKVLRTLTTVFYWNM